MRSTYKQATRSISTNTNLNIQIKFAKTVYLDYTFKAHVDCRSDHIIPPLAPLPRKKNKTLVAFICSCQFAGVTAIVGTE